MALSLEAFACAEEMGLRLGDLPTFPLLRPSTGLVIVTSYLRDLAGGIRASTA